MFPPVFALVRLMKSHRPVLHCVASLNLMMLFNVYLYTRFVMFVTLGKDDFPGVKAYDEDGLASFSFYTVQIDR